MKRSASALVLAMLASGCTDKAKPSLDDCVKAEAKEDWASAVRACEQATTLDPDSKSGKVANEKIASLKAKLAAKQKSDADAKATADAEARARQDAEDAKCAKWGTICTLGRFPDGSERTGGLQRYDTKAACENAGPSMGLKCDPCQCVRRAEPAASAPSPSAVDGGASPPSPSSSAPSSLTFVKVPAGSFVPGCLSGCSSGSERTVAAFEMSATEISQAQFGAYVAATGKEPKGACWTRERLDHTAAPKTDWKFPQEGDDHPVVCITRPEAMAYAAWLSTETKTQVRLPSASEFEFAARSGGQPNAYAWGSEWPPPAGAANVADRSAALLLYLPSETQPDPDYNDGWTYSAPVGKTKANALGLFDLTGNVYEWVADECVAHGGSWDNGNGPVLKTTGKYKTDCNGRSSSLGFRVVRGSPVTKRDVSAESTADLQNR